MYVMNFKILNTVACVYYVKLAWFQRQFLVECVLQNIQIKHTVMLIKKPHGCNNLQMNMESVDTTLFESRIKMYSEANLVYLQ